MISIDCTAVEDEVAKNMYQRSEMDCLIYNVPVSHADLILNGDPRKYLKDITDYTTLDKWKLSAPSICVLVLAVSIFVFCASLSYLPLRITTAVHITNFCYNGQKRRAIQ